MYFYHTTSLDYKLLKAGVFYGSSINMLTMLDKIKLFSIQQNFRTLATISTLLIFSIQPAYYYKAHARHSFPYIQAFTQTSHSESFYMLAVL